MLWLLWGFGLSWGSIKYKVDIDMAKHRKTSKEGRVDHLLFGLSSMLTQKLESKLSLPGLASGLTPILEEEIKRVIKPSNVIPIRYRPLSQVIGMHVDRILKNSTMEYPKSPKPEEDDDYGVVA